MADSIGVRLKRKREERRLTLEQASETTRIRVHYLKALESDDLSSMPSAAQARGFLRMYAEFLGLAMEELVPTAATGAEPVPVEPVEPEAEQTRAKPRVSASRLLGQLRDRLMGRGTPVARAQDEVAEAAPNSETPRRAKAVVTAKLTMGPAAPIEEATTKRKKKARK
jgi:transcriptional regulator with XRE-family HTH domain